MRLKRGLFFALIVATLAISVLDGSIASGDKDDQRHRNRYRQRHRDDDRGRSQLQAVSHPGYKENCGACHFAYQPELLPSESWGKILDRPDDHFGESIELDEETKKAIMGYLQTNGAEQSTAKRAVRIVRSLRGQVPTRITEIPYIR